MCHCWQYRVLLIARVLYSDQSGYYISSGSHTLAVGPCKELFSFLKPQFTYFENRDNTVT